jgi:hypothetical protein
MSAIRTKIMNHPLLDQFDDKDDSLCDGYRYFIRLVEGYRIRGYGGKTKHCLTLTDCLHYLDTAEEGEPW